MSIITPDRLERSQLSVPQIGKLWKGSPRRPYVNKQGEEILIQGEDLNYFRFTPNDGLHDDFKQRLLDAWNKIEGETDGWRSLSIRGAYRHAKECFRHQNASRDGGGRALHVCNGQTRTMTRDPKTKEITRGTFECGSQDGYVCSFGCKPEYMLRIIVPSLCEGGVVVLSGHSSTEVAEIKKQLEGIEDEFGDLRKVPMILSRANRNLAYRDKKSGKDGRIDKSLVYVMVDRSDRRPKPILLEPKATEHQQPDMEKPDGLGRLSALRLILGIDSKKEGDRELLKTAATWLELDLVSATHWSEADIESYRNMLFACSAEKFAKIPLEDSLKAIAVITENKRLNDHDVWNRFMKWVDSTQGFASTEEMDDE